MWYTAVTLVHSHGVVECYTLYKYLSRNTRGTCAIKFKIVTYVVHTFNLVRVAITTRTFGDVAHNLSLQLYALRTTPNFKNKKKE